MTSLRSQVKESVDTASGAAGVWDSHRTQLQARRTSWMVGTQDTTDIVLWFGFVL